jgi:DNA-binding CsgD family transcriptional regulator
MRRHSERDRKIFELKRAGLTLEELARQFGLQPGTIKSIVYAEKYRREIEREHTA